MEFQSRKNWASSGNCLMIALAGLLFWVGGTGCKKAASPVTPPSKTAQPDATAQDPNQASNQDHVATDDVGAALSGKPAATPQGGDPSQNAGAAAGDNTAAPDESANEDQADQQMQGMIAKLKALQNSPMGKQLAAVHQQQAAARILKATTLGPLPAWPGVAGRKIYTAPILQTPGMMIITAVQKDDGDYESSKTVDQATPQGVHLQIVTSVQKIHSERMVDAADLNAGAGYAGLFSSGGEVRRPGSTAISLSTQGLNRLRAGQTFPFHVQTEMSASMRGKGTYPESNTGTEPVTQDYSGVTMNACTLKRVEANDVAVPVLVNGQPVEVAALHAVCLGPNEEDHFWFLDQPVFPLTMAFRIGIERQGMQTIKIITPKSGASTMEAKLAAHEPVVVYGIYFDFNKDTIKPESKVVLTEIAGVMKQHPDWKLSVAGHTDNVGGAAPNLALSQRRSEAVKKALVSQYGVAADRLSTAGYGLSQPVATNDTLEGRARNRRVELRRQ